MLERLQKMLIKHEGFERRPYYDTVGKITIGCGRNLTDRGLSDKEILYLLNNDIAAVHAECQREFPWFRRLSETRQIVILSMAFNMGVPRLKGFRRMIAAIEDYRWTDAAIEALDSKWASDVGERAIELANMLKNDR